MLAICSLYTATTAQMADHTMCSTCKLEKDNLRNVSPKCTNGQWRCDDCSRLLNRVSRMQKNGSLASGYSEMTGDQKVEFMQYAMDMFGDDINKTINEIYECTTAETDTYNQRRSDEFLEYAEAEEKYKNRPETWERIKKTQLRSLAM